MRNFNFHKIVILTFLFSNFGRLVSQNEPQKQIDSLKLLLSKNINDTTQVITLIKIAGLHDYPEFQSNLSYKDSVYLYFKKAGSKAAQCGYSNFYAEKALEYCSSLYVDYSKPDHEPVRKVNLCLDVLKIFKDEKNKDKEKEAHSILSFLYTQIGDYDKAILHQKKYAYNNLTNGKGIDLVDALEELGDCFRRFNRFDSALSYYEKAFSQLITIPNEKLASRKVELINQICNSNLEQEFYNKIIPMYDRYDSLFIPLSDTMANTIDIKVRKMRIIGCTFHKLKKLNEAEIVLKKGIEYYKAKEKYFLNYGEIFKLYKEYGFVLTELGKYELAINSFLNSLTYAYKDHSKKAEILKPLSEAYEKNGDLKNALKTHKSYVISNDSAILFSNRTENIKQATILSLEYEFKNQAEKEQIENEKQKTLAEERHKKQNLIILFAIIGLVLLTFFSVFIFRSLLLTKKQKKLIEIQKAEVDEQKHIIQEKNNDIMDSIRYARRIQSSLLPTDKYLARILKKTDSSKGHDSK